jgi:hypothetical protein
MALVDKPVEEVKMGKNQVLNFPYGGGRTITQEEASDYKRILKTPKSGSMKEKILEINKLALEIVEKEKSRVVVLRDFRLD